MIPFLIVCAVVIVIGLIAGKLHGQSLKKMGEEVFDIGKATILPVIIVVVVVALVLLGVLYLWRGDWLN